MLRISLQRLVQHDKSHLWTESYRLMTAKDDAPLHRNLFHHAAQLAHPGHEFQGELSVVDGGRDSLVLRANRFLQHHFWDRRSHWGLDQVGGGAADRDTPNYFAAVSGVLFRERRKHSRARAHGKTGFRFGIANRQPIRGFDETIRTRQHCQRSARRRGGLCLAVQAEHGAEPAYRFALCCRAWFRSRRSLFHHACPRCGKLLDRSRAGAGIWLFQFSEYRPLSGCHFPAAFPADFWLDDSCGDHCQHPCAAAHQIARSTVSFDAASNHRVDVCVLAFPRVLEICAATLFQREFVSSSGSLLTKAASTATLISPADAG